MAGYAMKIQCIQCRKPLTDKQRTDNEGSCPKCGHRGDLAMRVVDCIFIATPSRNWFQKMCGWFISK